MQVNKNLWKNQLAKKRIIFYVRTVNAARTKMSQYDHWIPEALNQTFLVIFRILHVLKADELGCFLKT